MTILKPLVFLLWALLTSGTLGVKVSTSGYHVVHNDHTADVFNGFRFLTGNAPRYQTEAPVPVPFTLAFK